MTKIVLGLSALVILILISVVVILVLRYLRADDDDFDDLSGKRGRSTDNRDLRSRDRQRRDDLSPADGARQPTRLAEHEPRRAGSRHGRDEPHRAGGGGGERQSRRGGRAHEGREQRAARDSAEHGSRNDRSGHGSAEASGHLPGKREEQRVGQSPAQRQAENMPVARVRAGSRKRSADDGDWPSTDWDSLSDVDYWAELASDKPLTTTAQPAAPSRGARPDDRRDADQTADFAAAPTVSARTQPGNARRPAAGADAEPSLAMLTNMASSQNGQRLPSDADDDPLTSPSFPRISASESRSSGGRVDTPPGGSRYSASSSDPTQQFSSYGSAPAEPRAHGGPARPPGARSDRYRRPASSPATDELGLPLNQPFAPPAGRGGYRDSGDRTSAGQGPVSGGYPARLLPPAASGTRQQLAQKAPSNGPDGGAVPASPGGYSSAAPLGESRAENGTGYDGHLGGSSRPDSSYPRSASSGRPDSAGRGGWQQEPPPDPGSEQLRASSSRAAGGYRSGDGAGQPPGPRPAARQSQYEGAGHPAPDYPAPDYPAPDYPAPDYPAPGYPAPGYPAAGYSTRPYDSEPD